MTKIKIKEQTLEDIADAIRAKDGTEEPISPDDYSERIRSIPQGASVEDVQLNGTSIVEDGVANILTDSTYAGTTVLTMSGKRMLSTYPAAPLDLKIGAFARRTVGSGNINAAAFYGLAKAAGDTTQTQSSNPVGTYTDEAIVKILSMLGIVMISQADYDALPIKEQKLYLIFGGNS